ncbi:hypothetical protein VT84_29820 [Gemmata sp. SH-PL17]|uniref:hypothetical protein n=1 Tax=Gemmata sp. SH-PL17 TaxID=1630693 RepID=UPI0004B7D75E|nr:hypothetical protein [Gemmata sp. SH-PL17]AMV28640.1 hypothetical protein VT84_29820 [Gemmata sp. SH-PL17]
MPEIVLTEEQAKQLAGAVAPVEVKDSAGRVVGRLDPVLTPEFIAELKRRAATPGPRYSGVQIQARLQALQTEQDRIGRFDAEYAKAFLDRLEQADPGTYGPKGAS